MTIHCDPGYHPDDFTYRFHVIHYCSPDVPGNGLPWDAPTAWSAIGTGAFFLVILLCLAYLIIFDNKDRGQQE